MKSTHVTRTEN